MIMLFIFDEENYVKKIPCFAICEAKVVWERGMRKNTRFGPSSYIPPCLVIARWDEGKIRTY